MPAGLDFTCPRLVVRVAVTGHRPPKINLTNEAGIGRSVHQVLSEVLSIAQGIAVSESSAYAAGKPALHVISSLAEGADRIVAQEGIRLHASLQISLPAHRDEYRKDFSTAASAAEFDSLLSRSSNVFELDGNRIGEWLDPSAYAAAGHVAIGHCDFLLAIWDGAPGEEGGTAQLVREALRAAIPVVRIDVNNPAIVEFSPVGSVWHGPWRPDWRPVLRDALRNALAVPQSAAEWLGTYSREQAKSRSQGKRADELSVRYRNRYRRSYHVKYWLSALAVFFAVAGLMPSQAERRLWPSFEFACIACVLAGFFFASSGKWHERWINYRMLAEQFRVLDFLVPLGQTVPLFRPPVFWHDPGRHAWVSWYFRACLRQQGLPSVCITPEYLRQRRDDLLVVAEGQVAYHRAKHESTHRFHRYTGNAGIFLFGLTAVACVAHFQHLGPPFYLGASTAALPALAAALEGLQAQAEWQRISDRSERMSKYLQSLKDRLTNTPGDPSLPVLSAVAVDLAEAMTGETSEWHNLIHGKPLNLS
jgi:hypothetical protein